MGAGEGETEARRRRTLAGWGRGWACRLSPARATWPEGLGEGLSRHSACVCVCLCAHARAWVCVRGHTRVSVLFVRVRVVHECEWASTVLTTQVCRGGA